MRLMAALIAVALLTTGCSHLSPLVGKWKAADFPMEVEFLKDGS